MTTPRKFIALALAALLVSGCGDEPVFWPDREFNPSEWKTTKELDRYVFANDLLDGELIGLTREEIEAKLGPPSSNVPEQMRYAIKESTGGFDAVMFIYIQFDTNGKARKVGVGSD